MTRLILGVLLWSGVHFIPGMAVNLRRNAISRFGEKSYKAVFGLLMMFSIYLIISGWGSLSPEPPDVLESIYTPPDWGGHAAGLLVFIGFVLFLAPYPPNNFKRLLRHPQLIGLAAWGAGHLLAVGTLRSIVLFGGLTVWALIEIALINRRDGIWVRPDKAPLKNDLSMVMFSGLAYMAFLYTHHLLFGGSLLT